MAGHGHVALLTGEAGIGKTRAAEEFAECAGALSLWSRAYDDEGSPAHWPWLQILQSHLARCGTTGAQRILDGKAALIAELLPIGRDRIPAMSPPPPALSEVRFRLIEAIAAYLVEAAEEHRWC